MYFPITGHIYKSPQMDRSPQDINEEVKFLIDHKAQWTINPKR